MSNKYKFLSSILGSDGAGALRKAVQRDGRLEPIILPRAIIGWLSFIGNYEYEGSLPGIEDSYLEFTKSDDTFNGSIAIGEEIHEFHNSDIYHLASAISVSLGEDAQPIENDLRDLVLVRLGKSIDALAKAQEIARTLENRLKVHTQDLTKAISGIARGMPLEDGSFDFSHVLKPELKQAGYKIKVANDGEYEGKKKLEAQVYHDSSPDPIGVLEAYHKDGVMEPSVSTIMNEHKGKGLGQGMYEAMLAHGFHNGVHTIQGDIHSTDASNVHSKLAAKHGMDYNPTANPGAKPVKESTAYDGKFGPYKYTLKQEVSMDKADLPGKVQAPTKQLGPIGPTAPTKQGSLPRPSTKVALKVPSLKIGKSESLRPCEVCDGIQFNDNKFVGCICFSDLAKSIKTTAYSDGYALDFKKDFDKEAFLVLSKYFRS